MFKVGDKVVRDKERLGESFIEGSVYTVVGVGAGGVLTIDGVPGKWYSNYFSLYGEAPERIVRPDVKSWTFKTASPLLVDLEDIHSSLSYKNPLVFITGEGIDGKEEYVYIHDSLIIKGMYSKGVKKEYKLIASAMGLYPILIKDRSKYVEAARKIKGALLKKKYKDPMSYTCIVPEV